MPILSAFHHSPCRILTAYQHAPRLDGQKSTWWAPSTLHTVPVSAAKILEEIEGQDDGGADWVGCALREIDPTCKFFAVPEVFSLCLKI
jgi:hypothetical protein